MGAAAGAAGAGKMVLIEESWGVTNRVVAEPPDPADEVGGDAPEGGDVAGAMWVEVRAAAGGGGGERLPSRGRLAAAAAARLQERLERTA